MKEAVMKVIDTLTQEDFNEALQKLLERYKCIAAGGDYFEGDKSFMCALSVKCNILTFDPAQKCYSKVMHRKELTHSNGQ